jgi:UDP-N-acetylglucosamine 2-epimerase
MGKPVVNIGPRQSGRLKATCIIDCEASQEAITAALRRAVSAEFKAEAARTESLYGNSSASTQIVTALKRLDLRRNAAKRFHDLPG